MTTRYPAQFVHVFFYGDICIQLINLNIGTVVVMLSMSVQVLTLANNERIPLTSSMRLLFEISHLKHATPATVSRAGILYINPQELSWNL